MRERPFYLSLLPCRFDLALALGFTLAAFVTHGSELGSSVLAWVGAVIASLVMFTVVWAAPIAGGEAGALIGTMFVRSFFYHSRRIVTGVLTYLVMVAFICARQVGKLIECLKQVTWVWLKQPMFQRTAVPYERFPFTMCLLIL